MIFCCNIPVLRHFVSVLTDVARQNLRSPRSLDGPTFFNLHFLFLSVFYSSLLFSRRLLAAKLSFFKVIFCVGSIFSCSLLLSIHAITLFYLHFSTLLFIPNRQWFFPLNRAPVAEETNLKSYPLQFSIQPLLLCFTFSTHFLTFTDYLLPEQANLAIGILRK